MNEALVKTLLASPDHKNMVNGLSIIQREGSLADLQRVIELSKDEHADVRAAANTTAAHLILHNLINYFSQMDSKVRESLGKLLQRLEPDVLSKISLELYAEDEARRVVAVQVLGLMGESTRIRQVISEMVKDKDKKVRATAVHLLGKVIQGKDMTLVLALLNDSDVRVRANTIESLEEIGNTGAVGLLQRFRKDPSNRIRGNALKALWNLGYKDIMEDITACMSSPDHLMRASCAWVMGEIGRENREIIDLLASHAQDDHPLVRENVIKAQLKIGGHAAETYLKYLCQEDEVEKAKKTLKK